MFIGHYGPAFFESKGGDGSASIKLWQAFIAVQFIDIVHVVFLLIGLEFPLHAAGKVPLLYIPYSHSLLSALILSAIAGGFGYFAIERARRVFWVLFSLTFSHWILDWVVHLPDLPLYPGGANYGLGLWNFPILSYGLEMGLVLFGTIWWLSKSRARSVLYTVLPWCLFGIMALFQYTFIFAPPAAPSPVMTAVMAMITYIGLAGLIAWTESGRDWA